MLTTQEHHEKEIHPEPSKRETKNTTIRKFILNLREREMGEMGWVETGW